MSALQDDRESGDELEHVQLVSMSDVQPSIHRHASSSFGQKKMHLEHDTNEHDLREEIKVFKVETQDSNSMNLPSTKPPDEVLMDLPNHSESKVQAGSWPTLEILPGGVIKNTDKDDDLTDSIVVETADDSELMYACAKCPERFKYLVNLVKHVKWHEDQKKADDGKLQFVMSTFERDLIKIKHEQHEFEMQYKKQKTEIQCRISRAIEDGCLDEIFN